jgi:hypothetical protein
VAGDAGQATAVTAPVQRAAETAASVPTQLLRSADEASTTVPVAAPEAGEIVKRALAPTTRTAKAVAVVAGRAAASDAVRAAATNAAVAFPQAAARVAHALKATVSATVPVRGTAASRVAPSPLRMVSGTAASGSRPSTTMATPPARVLPDAAPGTAPSVAYANGPVAHARVPAAGPMSGVNVTLLPPYGGMTPATALGAPAAAPQAHGHVRRGAPQPNGTAPGAGASGSAGAASGIAPGGAMTILLAEIGLAVCALFKLLIAAERWRSTRLLSLLERPG